MTYSESGRIKKHPGHSLFPALLLAGLPLLLASLTAQAQEDYPASALTQAWSQQPAALLPAVSTTLLSEEFNPFDDQQLEDLVVAARQQQEAGVHAVALRLLDQAWQVSRVAYGLYHESQVPLLESMIATMGRVFPSIYVVEVPGSYNSVVFATSQPTEIENLYQNHLHLEGGNPPHPLLMDAYQRVVVNLQPFQGGGIVFTDDRAPVEWITNNMVLNFIFFEGMEDLNQ